MNEELVLKFGAFILGIVIVLINVLVIITVSMKVRKLNKKEPYNATGEACLWSQLGVLIPMNFGTTIAIAIVLIIS